MKSNMSDPEVEGILHYLSTKFNKIFYDREFVESVLLDFQRVLVDVNKCCVLVFPALDPIYQKAVRYQAKIFDLAVFSIVSGRFRSIAVCHKDHLLKKQSDIEESGMSNVLTKTNMPSHSAKKKRPERQLYIPPAQRRSRLIKSEYSVTKSDFKNVDSNVVDNQQKCNVKQCNSDRNQNSKTSIREHCSFDNEINNHLCTESDVKGANSSDNQIIIDSADSANVETTQIKCDTSEKLILNANEPPDKHPKTLAESDDKEVMNLPEKEVSEIVVVNSLCDSNKPNPSFSEFQNVVKITECSLSKEKIDKNGIADEIKTENNVKDEIKNKLNQEKIKQNSVNSPLKKNEHEEEKEIMRRAKENMNRKTRPIFKYVEDRNDLLRIDRNEDNINNWEDLFDEEGQLQEHFLSDITEKVGEEVTIVTALEDYSAYTSKVSENLEHIVELFDFPSSFETHDIMQAFSFIKSDAMYIKWIDDTRALLVLGSLSQAQRALEQENPLIKVRPMNIASSMALSVAIKSDLKPAMKRPQTNLQTARRLITTHLGAKSNLSKEQSAKEKEDLRNARELKKKEKQYEKDAWEGNIRSSIKR